MTRAAANKKKRKGKAKGTAKDKGKAKGLSKAKDNSRAKHKGLGRNENSRKAKHKGLGKNKGLGKGLGKTKARRKSAGRGNVMENPSTSIREFEHGGNEHHNGAGCDYFNIDGDIFIFGVGILDRVCSSAIPPREEIQHDRCLVSDLAVPAVIVPSNRCRVGNA